MNETIEPRKNGDFNVSRTDFSTWERKTLELFARECADELHAVRAELRTALDAYRRLVLELDNRVT